MFTVISLHQISIPSFTLQINIVLRSLDIIGNKINLETWLEDDNADDVKG
jgi:hypothetical protein